MNNDLEPIGCEPVEFTQTEPIQRPRVLLSAAVSLDGYLDHAGPSRLVLSSKEDADAVDALRSVSDAILIGAGTARRDDPLLMVRSPARQEARALAGQSPTPMRVVLTQSGKLPADLRVLNSPEVRTRVYCPAQAAEHSDGRWPPHVEVVPLESCTVATILSHLHETGVHRLLVEGGQGISSLLLEADLADELRIAWCPVLVGCPDAPRFGGRLRLDTAMRPTVLPLRVDILDDAVVAHYTRSVSGRPVRSDFVARSDSQWLAEAVELGRRCPPTDRAFSVGAILVGTDGVVIATGFSREGDPSVHAEEVALNKARRRCVSTEGATLYSSMEPCSRRLSGRKPCVEHIIEAGVGRVVYALAEPPVFVQCEGHETLVRAGIEVVQIQQLGSYVEEMNAPALSKSHA